MKFGVITDVQYADINRWDVAPEREYRLAPSKLTEAIDFLNTQQDLDFVVHLGDVIDKYVTSFDELAPVFERLTHKLVHVLGNHDFKATDDHKRIPVATVLNKLGMPAKYYSMVEGAWKFIVLDTNEVGIIEQDDERNDTDGRRLLAELKQKQAVNAHSWNGTISDMQQKWLRNQLDQAEKADQSVLLFAHHPVAPLSSNMMLEPQRITQFFAQYPCVKAYLNGHDHDGAYAEVEGVPCVTFKALLDTTENSYAIVELDENRLRVEGYGREHDRELVLR